MPIRGNHLRVAIRLFSLQREKSDAAAVGRPRQVADPIGHCTHFFCLAALYWENMQLWLVLLPPKEMLIADYRATIAGRYSLLLLWEKISVCLPLFRLPTSTPTPSASQ